VSELKERIEQAGQRYVDEPVKIEPRKRSFLEESISAAFGGREPRAIVVGHQRFHLRWMTPDGNGGLKPRK